MDRLLRATTFVLLFAIVVAACGGGDSSSDPTATTASEAAPTATVAATTASEESESTEVTSDEATATTEPEATSTTASSDSATPTTESATPTTAAAEPTATADSGGDTPTSDFAFGWNVGLRGDEGGAEHNQRTGELVIESGFGWVRFQVEWSSFERQPEQWDPLPVDRRIDEMHAQGLKILICIAKAPDWALSDEPAKFLRDYNEFARFTEFLAIRYKGKVQAYEIWNEQNLALEVNGEVNVGEYVNLLRSAFFSIKSVDPDSLIVFGGLTPNGVNDPSIAVDDAQYLREAYEYNGGEIALYFDVLGVHLNGTHNSPDNTWPDNVGENEGWNDHPSFFFRRAEELRQIQIIYADANKPMWITEVGWSTENMAEGRGYGVNNTEEEVAEYLTRALEIATTEWDFVTAAFIWNLNWATLVEPEHHMYPSSAVRADWSPRPAYEAMKAFPK